MFEERASIFFKSNITGFCINTTSKLFYSRRHKKTSKTKPIKFTNLWTKIIKLKEKFKEFILGLFGYFNEDIISVYPTF